jgi:hypothetical protein
MQAPTAKVSHIVQPDTTYTWELELTAPERVGKYTAYFRM